MNHNLYYKAGVFTGILFVMLIFLIIQWVKKKGSNNSNIKEYDERQLLARGQAAKYGFWVATFYMLLIGILNPRNVATDSLMYLGACLGLLVFGCTCVIRDAYFPVSSQSKPKTLLIILILIVAAVSNVIQGIYSAENEVHFLNLLLGIMLTIILLVLLGKFIYDKRKEKNDHEA